MRFIDVFLDLGKNSSAGYAMGNTQAMQSHPGSVGFSRYEKCPDNETCPSIDCPLWGLNANVHVCLGNGGTYRSKIQFLSGRA